MLRVIVQSRVIHFRYLRMCREKPRECQRIAGCPLHAQRQRLRTRGDAVRRFGRQRSAYVTQTFFADGLVIQHAADVFIFSFLKTEYPLVDKPEEYAKLTEVEQRCISQVVVSVEQMARNINVLNKTANRLDCDFIKHKSVDYFYFCFNFG